MSSEQEDGGQFRLGEWPELGMSLRDYFAAKAMAAMLSLEVVHANCGESELAKWSYQQADAMLAERNRLNEC